MRMAWWWRLIMSNYQRVVDILTTAKNISSQIDFGPSLDPPFEFAKVQYYWGDYQISQLADALKSDDSFVWGLDKWGDTNYKVSD